MSPTFKNNQFKFSLSLNQVSLKLPTLSRIQQYHSDLLVQYSQGSKNVLKFTMFNAIAKNAENNSQQKITEEFINQIGSQIQLFEQNTIR